MEETMEKERPMKDPVKLTTLCSIAVISLALTACNQTPAAAPDTHDADVKAISDLETQWSKDYAGKDVEKIVSYYTDDAVLMTPGAEAMRGKDGIRAALKGMMGDPAFSLSFQAVKVDTAKAGDVGYSWGTYQLAATDPATHKVIHDHGNYVTTYRKQTDGSWKAVTDIASSAVAPQPPPKHA
jgi:uncharacterized protein (TIGR02246 family)